jgi:hypothetical protein
MYTLGFGAQRLRFYFHTLGVRRCYRLGPKPKAQRPKEQWAVVGGWVGQRPKKDQGQICCFDLKKNGIFKPPSTRNAQKRDTKKIEKKSVLDFGLIFKKLFDAICFAKRFL